MELTAEMIIVLALLAFTIVLFVTEIVRTDVAAVLVLALLGGTTLIPGLEPLLDAEQLLAGFSSNAVIAIIAVMIIGEGLDKTGLMAYVAAWVVKLGGRSERRIVALLASTAGLASSIIQNVGVVALFLPVASRITTRTDLPLSRLLIPLAFCTILGGTITMVGCSPLIIVNDLIRSINATLAAEQRIEPFHLFAIAPVGLALLAMGILFFLSLGPKLLPKPTDDDGARGKSTLDYFKRIYGLEASVHEVAVPVKTPLTGQTIGDVEQAYKLRIIATQFGGKIRLAPPAFAEIEGPAVLGVVGQPGAVARFAESNGLRLRKSLSTFAEALVRTEAGVGEVMIPPNSSLIGKSIRDLRIRITYGLTLLAIHRGGNSITEEFFDIPFQAGDTLVCYTRWEDLARLEGSRDFVVVTADYPHEEQRPHKVGAALLFFTLSLALVLCSDMSLSVALLIGAIGMVLTKVLSMDEAYRAVSWKTVFLLAGLIPLGQAVQSSGTAEWIAQQALAMGGGLPAWGLQTVLALLATGFSLVMSNVGATVLLVPLAVNIAIASGSDPALFVLTVAIATSNAFLIPTNQVNALVVGPAGYRVGDFLKVGGVMTVLFLVVSLFMLNLVF